MRKEISGTERARRSTVARASAGFFDRLITFLTSIEEHDLGFHAPTKLLSTLVLGHRGKPAQINTIGEYGCPAPEVGWQRLKEIVASN
jgi:hypothetical protein